MYKYTGVQVENFDTGYNDENFVPQSTDHVGDFAKATELVASRRHRRISNGESHVGRGFLRVSEEELECLATWKEGSSRYLVGRLHHGHSSSNEDRFRCFVYERASQAMQGNLNRAEVDVDAIDHDVDLLDGPVLEGEVYRLAQSGDATCNGLFSPMEGSRTMMLKKGECRP